MCAILRRSRPTRSSVMNQRATSVSVSLIGQTLPNHFGISLRSRFTDLHHLPDRDVQTYRATAGGETLLFASDDLGDFNGEIRWSSWTSADLQRIDEQDYH